MREIYDVHQAEDQRQTDRDQAVEQPHQQAAGERLDDGLGGQRRCSWPEALRRGAVIASEAKQSIAQRKERMDCFVATLLAMTKRARDWMMVSAVKGKPPSHVVPANAGTHNHRNRVW